MARFLFVVPPLVGHVNPTVAVAGALQARGHEVAWVGHPTRVRPLLPDGAVLHPLSEDVSDGLVAEIEAEAARARGLASLKLFWEGFALPLARAMLPQVDHAVDTLAPDVLVVDQQAIAGALVARRRSMPWATSSTTSASVVEPLADFPKVLAWRDRLLDDLQRDAGLDPIPDGDRSPHLVLVYSTPALIGRDDFPDHYAFVGPALDGRPQREAFPWEALRPGPRVLVSLGTVNAERGGRFYRAVVEGIEAQVILAAPPALVGPVPDHVIVRRRVPQLALLPHVDAVVCHAGHNTVCESLLHGLPLVVAPIKDDQPVVAGQVVNAGAGVRLRFGRAGPSDLRDAVRAVLTEASYRDAAARIRASFEAAGGAEAAAARLEAQFAR